MSRCSVRISRAVLKGKTDSFSNPDAQGNKGRQGSKAKGKPARNATLKPITVLRKDLERLTEQQKEAIAEANTAIGVTAAAEQALHEARNALKKRKSSVNTKRFQAAQDALDQAKATSKSASQKATTLKGQVARLSKAIVKREASESPADDSELTDIEALDEALDKISQDETDAKHAKAVQTAKERANQKQPDARENPQEQGSSTPPVIGSPGTNDHQLASTTDAGVGPSPPSNAPSPQEALLSKTTPPLPERPDDASESDPKTASPAGELFPLPIPQSLDPNLDPIPKAPISAVSASRKAPMSAVAMSPKPTTTAPNLPDSIQDSAPINLFTPEHSPAPQEISHPGAECLTSAPRHSPNGPSRAVSESPATTSGENAGSKASATLGEDELDPDSESETLRPPKLSKKRKLNTIESDEEGAVPQSAKKVKAVKAPTKRKTRKHEVSEDDETPAPTKRKTRKRKVSEDDETPAQTNKKRHVQVEAPEGGNGDEEDQEVVDETGEEPPTRRRKPPVDKKLVTPPDVTQGSKAKKIKRILAWYEKAVNGVGPSAITDASKTLGIRTLLYESASILPELVTTAKEIALAALISTEGSLICRYHTINDKSIDKPGPVDGDDGMLFGRPWPWIHLGEKRKVWNAQQVEAAARAKAAMESEEMPTDPQLLDLSKRLNVPGWKVVDIRGTDKTDCGCDVRDVLLEIILWKTGKLTSPSCKLIDDWRADFLNPRQRALVCAQYREGTLLDADDLYSMSSENGRWIKRDKVHHRRVQAERALKIIEAEADAEKKEEAKGDAAISSAMTLMKEAKERIETD
ncbi:hypothetical protein VNI00_018308 [Paramarasmius palmivorus]|uniref:Uncharacterized protein n=1 Tax=Paramarasmius palmivorus TaxID=297713 RepID=A0AAW0AZD8_9AGAR